MDQVDHKILHCLQNQARMSMTELGKGVGLSQPAVTERVRRMEDKGIITGYRAMISHEKVGKPIMAHLLVHTNQCNSFVEFCQSSPEVIECHRISGEHNYLLKVITESMLRLEEFGDECGKHGHSTTLIVLSSPVEHKFLTPGLLDNA
jgi:DNA-binding Lrp family transcriptional regulator